MMLIHLTAVGCCCQGNIMWRTRTWGADTKRILEDAQRGVFPQPPELWL